MNEKFKFPEFHEMGQYALHYHLWRVNPPKEEIIANKIFENINRKELLIYLDQIFVTICENEKVKVDQYWERRLKTINQKFSSPRHKRQKKLMLEIHTIERFWSSNSIYREFYLDNIDNYDDKSFSKNFVKFYLSRISKLEFGIFKLKNIHNFENDIKEAIFNTELFHKLNKSTRTIKSLFKSPEVFESFMEKLKTNRVLIIEKDEHTKLDLYSFSLEEKDDNLSEGKLAVAFIFIAREFLKYYSNRKISEAIQTSFGIDYTHESVRKSKADFEKHEHTRKNKYLNHLHFLK